MQFSQILFENNQCNGSRACFMQIKKELQLKNRSSLNIKIIGGHTRKDSNYPTNWPQPSEGEDRRPKQLSYRVHINVIHHTKKIKDYPKTSFTRSAASFRRMAEYSFNPDSSMILAPSSALVPCRRTMMGTFISPMFL